MALVLAVFFAKKDRQKKSRQDACATKKCNRRRARAILMQTAKPADFK
jgi:hypothetical protein